LPLLQDCSGTSGDILLRLFPHVSRLIDNRCGIIPALALKPAVRIRSLTCTQPSLLTILLFISFLSAGLSHFHFSTLLTNMFLGLPANPIFPGFP